MIIKIIKPRLAFTLMEILVVVALLVTLAIALLVTLNPWAQINKSHDAKRKHELTQLSKEFEDYYNDNNCYPPPEKVCYDAAVQRPDGTYTCNICGNESTTPDFSPYMTRLPCDPRQPLKKYLYQIDNSTCPSFYRTYTLLTYDPKEYCTSDSPSETDYNWGVSSPNTQPLINCTGVTPTLEGSYYCQAFGNCAFYNNVVWTCNPSYTDSQCTGSNNCIITGSCQKK